jgi:hypothetical protein
MRYYLGIITLLYFCFFTYSSCQKENNRIAGSWKMAKITFDKKDVSEEHNPKNNRNILFSSDGKFVSDGDPYGKNVGTYTFMVDTLFLNSPIEGDDSFWTVKFSKDTMIWTGVGTE